MPCRHNLSVWKRTWVGCRIFSSAIKLPDGENKLVQDDRASQMGAAQKRALQWNFWREFRMENPIKLSREISSGFGDELANISMDESGWKWVYIFDTDNLDESANIYLKSSGCPIDIILWFQLNMN